MTPLGEKISPVTQQVVDVCSQRWRRDLADRYGPLPARVLALMGLQSNGGPCPKCAKPWKQRSVKNRFTNFSYYEPGCSCWKPCPGIDQVFAYDGNPTVRKHHIKKSCGNPSFIDQELFGRVHCEECHGEIEMWEQSAPVRTKAAPDNDYGA